MSMSSHEHSLTLKVLVMTIDAWDTLKKGNHSTVGGDGGCRGGEVQASTTSLIPNHKGFKLQELSRDPLTPAAGPRSLSV